LQFRRAGVLYQSAAALSSGGLTAMAAGRWARRLAADQRSQGRWGRGVCERCSATTRCLAFLVRAVTPMSLEMLMMVMT